MKECKITGCDGKYYGKGYCEKHYQQVRKHGKILKRTVYDPNEIIIKNNVAEIVLYNQKGKEVAKAMVDVGDVEKIKKYKWHAVKNGTRLIPATTVNKRNMYLANLIMDFNSDNTVMVDHKDRKPLNCRKYNLRRCTATQNSWNRGISKNNTSGHKGVSWNKNEKKWDVRLTVHEKQVFIGKFNDKAVAAEEYNEAARKYYGDFAYA